MKKLFLFMAMVATAFGADAANDLIISQRKADNSGNIQRNVAPTANAALGVNASKIPVALTAFTQDSATGAASVASAGTNQPVNISPSGTGSLNLQQGVDIEFGGTMLYPIFLSGVMPVVVVPETTAAGRATYVPTTGVSVGFMNISGQGDTAPMPGLTSIKFWNVVQGGTAGGTFNIDSFDRITSVSFPVLTVVNTSFGINTMGALTTFSLPVLKYVNGDFNPNTMAVLTTLSTPELVSLKQGYAPATMALLTTLNADKLVNCGGTFAPGTMAALTSLSFPELVNVGRNMAPTAMASLTTWSFPKLKYVGINFSPNTMGALTSLTTPELLYVGANTAGGNYAPTTMALLTTLTAAKMTDINGTFAPTTMAALTTLSFPAVARITGAVSAASMASLTTISMPAMITYGSTITYNSGLGNLTSVTLGTIGTLKAITGATINISGQKLTSANVNAILALLVSLDGTNGTTLWGAGKTLTINGGTNGAPSGQGITDKATLITRGATVTTN